MERKVIISTDSTADLTPQLIEQYNIQVAPLGIEMGGKLYRDGLDITPDDLYAFHQETGTLAHSSAFSIGEYEDHFSALTKQGYDVVHVGLADYLSCTLHNAQLAAEDMENVFVVNSKRLSTGIGLLVLRACELAQSGMGAKEISKTIAELAYHVDASFVVDTLEYLHAGGRCSGVAKFGANLLKIKPQIVVYDDKMDTGKKYRGKINACRAQYIEDQLQDIDNICLDRIFLTHSGMPQEDIDMALEKIRSVANFKEILVTRAGCVISCHCGPGTMGVLFIRKNKVFEQ
ncbi:MAG: DegV family protein [Clostridia bacterium]|nr:DegV family protein [Clostridia bacterium]